MADNKKFSFQLDMSAMTKQLNSLIEQLNKTKKGLQDTGKAGTKSFSDLEKFIINTQNKIRALTLKIQKAIVASAQASSAAIKANAASIRETQAKIERITADTANKIIKLEEAKRKASRAATTDALRDLNTLRSAREKAAKATQRFIDQAVKARQKASKANQASLDQMATLSARAIGQQIRDRERLIQAMARQRQSQLQLNEAWKAAAYATISANLTELIKKSALLAAQNEVLGTAMNVVGVNMGFTRTQLLSTEDAMRTMGISIKDSRTTIQRFAQSSLTMTQAVQLGRAAQDLAAGSIHGSSEALNTMTNAIISQYPRQLRQYGIVVNLNDVYRDHALTLGKSVPALTKLEKRQALFNVVIDEARKRAGAYEASMEDVGKKLTSLTSRVIPDTLSAFGDSLLPLFTILTQATYDLLQGLQKLGDGWQGLITVIVSGLAIFTTLKTVLAVATTALTTFGLATSGAGLAVYKIGVFLAGAAWPITLFLTSIVALSAAWNWYSKQQDAAYISSIKTLSIHNKQKSDLKDLKDLTEDLTVSEEQLARAAKKEAREHRSLRPLLTSSKIDRVALARAIDEVSKELEKNTQKLRDNVTFEAVDRVYALADAHDELKKRVTETNKRQEMFTGALETHLGVSEFYGELLFNLINQTAKLSGFLARLFDIFTLDWSGGVVKAWRELTVAFSNIEERELDLVEAGQKVTRANQDVEDSFNEMTDAVKTDAQVVATEIKKIEKALAKRGKRGEKQFPFEEMNKFYEAQRENLSKLAATHEERERVSADITKRYAIEKAEANRKYTEFLASLGKSELERLDILYKDKLLKAKGSEEAQSALAIQYTQARNEIFKKQLTSRTKDLQDSTKNMIDIRRQQLDTNIKAEKASMEVTANDESATFSRRADARRSYVDKVLSMMKMSQIRQETMFKEGADIRLTNLQMLLEKGIISEEEYKARVIEVNTSITDFHLENLDKRIGFIRSTIDEAISEEKRLADEIRKLGEERLNIERRGEDAIEKINRDLRTDYDNYVEDQLKADRLLEEARTKLRQNDFKGAKKLADDSLRLSQGLNKEITTGYGEQKQAVVDKHTATQIALKKTVAAVDTLKEINEVETRAAVNGRQKNISLIEEMTEKLKTLTAEKWEAEVVVKGEAEKDLTAIQNLMEKLNNTVATVTVIVNKIVNTATSTSGIGEDIAASEGESGPINPIGQGGNSVVKGLAKGDIDIEGPGDERSDSIFARLSKGESVITAQATKMFKPILELMEQRPMALKDMLVPALKGLMPSKQVSSGGTVTLGNLTINLNGVENVSDFEGIDWRNVVREKVAPQLKILNKRSKGL